MTPTITTIDTQHVDFVSQKTFERTVKDLSAELGKASAEKLMDRLSGCEQWDTYAGECTDFAGRSNLIEVGHLNWGKVLTLSGTAMKARCFIVGNPTTAQKLLSAGGAQVGLYLPTKIFVHESQDGSVHVSFDKMLPVFKGLGLDQVDAVAAKIDAVLEKLAVAACDGANSGSFEP